MHFVFVILHYIAFEETCECIDSIVKKISGNFNIIIVDNGSKDGSGEKLKEKYNTCKNVEIIINEENVGFARGNNLGYDYAVKKYNPDFIICLNNDTVMIQEDFLTLVENKYNEMAFGVLGPDIIAGNGNIHQNPAHYIPFTSERLKMLIKVKRIYLLYLKNKSFGKIVYKISYALLRRIYNLRYNEKNKLDNVILHGACLVFSRQYMELFHTAFYPETFLYLEEDILQFLCRKREILMVYDSNIKIHHLEDISTNHIVKTMEEKEIFKTEYFLDSAHKFLDLMYEYR